MASAIATGSLASAMQLCSSIRTATVQARTRRLHQTRFRHRHPQSRNFGLVENEFEPAADLKFPDRFRSDRCQRHDGGGACFFQPVSNNRDHHRIRRNNGEAFFDEHSSVASSVACTSGKSVFGSPIITSIFTRLVSSASPALCQPSRANRILRRIAAGSIRQNRQSFR